MTNPFEFWLLLRAERNRDKEKMRIQSKDKGISWEHVENNMTSYHSQFVQFANFPLFT